MAASLPLSGAHEAPDTFEVSSQGMIDAGRAVGQASAMLNHAVAERLGLHPTSWECLSMLFEHGTMPAGRLAELTGLTTGAITGLVDRLEEAGFVARQRDPADRRRVIVELAPTAFQRVHPLFGPMLYDMHTLHRGYTCDQMAAMRSCLQGAADVLRHHALRLRAECAAQRCAPAECIKTDSP